MKRRTTTGFAILLAAISHGCAVAGGRNFEQRLQNHEWCIEQGIASGALTHQEASELRREQEELRGLAGRFWTITYPTARDRHILNIRFDRARTRISALKHNGRDG